MKIAVCCIVKNENRYLDEWVDHYLNKLGFDHIFIYDHNDIDGEVIKDFGENVSVINFRGHIKPCQELAYKECYEKYLFNSEYKWCLFVDVDEFLEIPETDNDVKKFLSLPKYITANEIMINWVYVNDNGLIRYENKPLKERFKGGEVWDIDMNRHTKPFLKCTSENVNFRCPHIFLGIKDGRYFDAKGNRCIHSGLDSQYMENNKFAYIKHYNTKTIEEFLWKIERGFPDGASTDIDYFFQYNEDTPEKREFVKNYLEKKNNENKVN